MLCARHALNSFTTTPRVFPHIRHGNPRRFASFDSRPGSMPSSIAALRSETIASSADFTPGADLGGADFDFATADNSIALDHKTPFGRRNVRKDPKNYSPTQWAVAGGLPHVAHGGQRRVVVTGGLVAPPTKIDI